MLISRTIEGENWVKGRSRCDHCKKALPWFDNIPLLSFMVLGGRSRCCKRKLSLQYPVVEAMTGLLFVWWLLVGRFFFQLVESPLSVVQPGYWLIVGFILVGVFFADLFYGVIPDLFVWIGLAASFFYRLVLTTYGVMRIEDFVGSMVSAVLAWLFFYLLYIVTKRKGMGYGDVKFAAVLGLVLGWPRVFVGILSSFVLGAIVGVTLILMGKKRFGQTVPFGPFMVLGMVVALVWGLKIWELVGF